MRKTASLGGGLANSELAIPGCEATSSPEVKCGGNKAITENVPVLNHQDTHELTPRKVTNGDTECICGGNFICDGLTLNSNNKGTLLNKGVMCIPKALLSDLVGEGKDGQDGSIPKCPSKYFRAGCGIQGTCPESANGEFCHLSGRSYKGSGASVTWLCVAGIWAEIREYCNTYESHR